MPIGNEVKQSQEKLAEVENILNSIMANVFQQKAKDILSGILTTLKDASVIVFSHAKNKNKFLADGEKADKSWESFVKSYLTEKPLLKEGESFHAFLQRHSQVFVEISNLRKMETPAPEKLAKILHWLKKEKWEKLFEIVSTCYSNLPPEAKEKLLTILNSQQEAEKDLVSILRILDEASVIAFSEEENPNKFLANDVKADKGWKIFVGTYLTENPKLREGESFHAFLQRHSQIFVEINDLLKIEAPEPERLAKVLDRLKVEGWDKLLDILNHVLCSLLLPEDEEKLLAVLTILDSQREAENCLLSILKILDEASVIAFSEEKDPNRFLAKDPKAEKGWRTFVNAYLTENPKLLEGESFHAFLQRHRLIFLEINNLKNSKVPDGEKILKLLFQLIEEHWDKLFHTVLKRYFAAEVRYEDEIKPFNINGKSKEHSDRALVHKAVQENNDKILRELIVHEADLEVTAWASAIGVAEFGGFTALHYAAVRGSTECMEILIKQGVSLNTVTADFKESALHLAADRGSMECVKLLVDSGAKLDAENSEGKIPYQLAREKKHRSCMQYLAVEMRRQEIPIPDEKSKEEESEAVELKTRGTFVPSRDDLPLDHALPQKVLSLILSFLDDKALKKIRLQNGFFAKLAQKNSMWVNFITENLTEHPQLQWGENFYNYLKRHEKILSAYQKSNQADFKGIALFDLLWETVTAGWEKLFITILDKHPEFNVNGYSRGVISLRLIHLVVARDNVVMLRKLIEREKKSNSPEEKSKVSVLLNLCAAGHMAHEMGGDWVEGCGNNPLQQAAEDGAHECMKLLLTHKNQYDIDRTTSDDSGQSALHLAAKRGDITSVILLVDNGASLTQGDKKGNTPYLLARNNGHEECANYLAKAMEKANIPIPKTTCILQ